MLKWLEHNHIGIADASNAVQSRLQELEALLAERGHPTYTREAGDDGMHLSEEMLDNPYCNLSQVNRDGDSPQGTSQEATEEESTDDDEVILNPGNQEHASAQEALRRQQAPATPASTSYTGNESFDAKLNRTAAMHIMKLFIGHFLRGFRTLEASRKAVS